MQCLGDLEVLDYLERRVSDARVAEVREHIDTCGHCLSLIDQLAQGRQRAPVDGLTLGRTISSGGMGVIVEAYDTRLERRIALKLPRTDDVLMVLRMHEQHIARFADRLTSAQRHEALRRRHREALTGLIAARAWGPALRSIARAA